MASIQPQQKDQRSAGLTLNLSSNNPFRNLAAPPSNLPQSPVSPFDDPPSPGTQSPRPVSRNPFLDPTIKNRTSQPTLRKASDAAMSTLEKRTSPTAEELFDGLTIEDKKSAPLGPPRPDGTRGTLPPMNRRPPPPGGRENIPPPGRRAPPPNHRPTRSQEEALRARRMQGNGDGPGPVDHSRSPQRRPDRRPRRNSESSVMDAEKTTTDEERKIRDMRRRERERRHREHREHREKKPVNRKLDIIDQLDATSIYGTGMFHHDGPFDALNPHRNKHGSRRAPMQAFPEGSLNNTLGGSGPLNARPDHSAFLGHNDDEAFKEWSSGAKDRSLSKGEMPVFDPLSRGNILHGDETLGLGTSTFLEGTPAARTAIQKREEEQAANIERENLQRKKSIAHRIRNINRGTRDYQPSGRMTNPDGVYSSRRTPSESGNPTSSSMQTPNSERNPFFSEYEPGKKGEENISVRKVDSNGGMASPTSPKGGYGLERRATTDATATLEEQQSKSSGGILGRMKSLKGGRRQRPGPPGGGDAGPAPGTAA
ncbi:protein PAL1 [Diplogelasinospora grovesii]|uniref:Protein PAL1 n=1 Tax=Diplogelasinospora grovesii TaxID=303347 RepID=A0AAN6NCT6_9PEZI|nr:protein PAL1 [Diplogelasinospora grovesii]